MAAVTPWTVVTHAADHTPPAVATEHLAAWLAGQGNVDLHTVVWTAGKRGTEPYAVGRLADVGAVRRRLLPPRLERIGLKRLGGGLRGRAVRSALSGVPTDGVLYLSSGFSGSVLRYLPPGERTVVTHLHAMDRMADPRLGPDDVGRLRDATDVWLATDEATARWAETEWGIDEVDLVPAPVDPDAWNRATRLRTPGELRLGLAGAAWFRPDHSARLAQHLRRRRPELDLQLVWAQTVLDPAHLAPLRHDLEGVGAGELELPTSSAGPLAVLDDVDAVALTAPDEEAPWIAWEAAARGVPVVCFDTHRAVPSVVAAGGVVVPYPDVGAMARALVDIHDDDGSTAVLPINARRAALRERDVAIVGCTIIDLAGGGPP